MTRPPSPGRASATAPANIAFIKYWGARDLTRVLPFNPSISMTLSRCVSHSTVETLAPGGGDEVYLAGEDGALTEAPAPFAERVAAHLSRLRTWAGRREGFRVATRNSFPAAAGLASSASGFAALTVATVSALGTNPSPAELSALARRSGSGSAARSVYGGYVQWPGGEADRDDGGSAIPLFPASHWDLRDVIALLETGAKAVSSLEGHRRAVTSPYFETRLALLPERLERARRAIAERDFDLLAVLLEEEAVDLHLIAMSSRPPVFYWTGGSLEVLATVRSLRAAGLAAASTLDAGANVHVLCLPQAEEAVAARLAAVPGVRSVIRDRVGDGPRLGGEDLLA